MKLKKIASLMLAGVMAVSMLAGCSGNGSNGGNGGEGEGQVDTDSLSAASIIAELNEDTTEKVTFSANSSLENALNKAVSVVGSGNLGDTDYVARTTADIAELDLVRVFTFPKAEKDEDLDAETRIWSAYIPAIDLSEKAAVDVFAELVDGKVEDLVKNDQCRTASKDKVADDDTYTKYSYTGNIAVVKVEDVTTGYTGYIGVITVTCTPAEATASL